jgi:hypothetical protein
MAFMTVRVADLTDDPDSLARRLTRLPKDRPKVYATVGTRTTACHCCGRAIRLGASTYELEFNALKIRLDRVCFVIYQNEVLTKKT